MVQQRACVMDCRTRSMPIRHQKVWNHLLISQLRRASLGPIVFRMPDLGNKFRKLLAATGRPDFALAMVAGFLAWMIVLAARWLAGIALL